MRRAWVVAVLLAYVFAGRPVVGQAAGPAPAKMMPADADPSFEVAAIKLSDPNDQSDGFHSNGRHFNIENQTVEKLLVFSYGVHRKQLVDEPDRFRSERYDIDGVPDVEGEPSLKQMQGMVRKLLADRFALKVGHEKRELAVYAITPAKGGPKLTKSAGDPNGQL